MLCARAIKKNFKITRVFSEVTSATTRQLAQSRILTETHRGRADATRWTFNVINARDDRAAPSTS